MKNLRLILPFLLIASLGLGGCVTNPVTGETELGLVSEEQERQIGEQQYGPGRQMQGGDYVTDPALVNYVREVGGRLAAVSDRPLDYEFNVLNNSVPNAWALPGGKIAINRGLLLEMNSEAELAAVLGHEIVHAAARHGAKGMERGLLLQGAVLAAAVATHDSDYSQYAVGAAALAAQLLNQKYGRGAELESDHYGMVYMSRAGYDLQGAVDLQETFVRLSEGRRQDWLSGLFASHPPSQDRVDANRATAAELGTDGRTGADSYQRMLARLRAATPAYEAHDQGRKALAEGNAVEAIKLASNAIQGEPEEAQFYGLKGDAEFARQRYGAAVKNYSEALRRNDQYFKYYLGRGESYRKMGQANLAQQDLETSNELLPTADAHESLGSLHEQAGNNALAIQHYEVAAGSNTPAGTQSTVRLIELDLPRRPDRYIGSAKRVDQSGRVYIELLNRTAVPLGRIVIQIGYYDAQGRVRREQKIHSGVIQPGQGALVMLGAGQYAASYDALEHVVRDARVAEG